MHADVFKSYMVAPVTVLNHTCMHADVDVDGFAGGAEWDGRNTAAMGVTPAADIHGDHCAIPCEPDLRGVSTALQNPLGSQR
jgi:hypothetical protein